MKKALIALTALILSLAGPAAAAPAESFSTLAKQAIVVDYNTGQVLFEKNADEKMPTSSMSKVMTIYALFEQLKSGALTMDSELSVSEKAWRMGGSKMFVEVGKKVKVSDLMRGVIVQSGNDATVVLAEGMAGTEDAFAQAITRKAQDLGMKNTNFANASGWPDPNHYSTARDLSLLAASIIRDFPDLYPHYAEKEFTYHGIKQPNRNPLLYKDLGADGIKTGHTEAGGYGLIGSAVRDGRRVIIVLNGMKDETERAEESARIMDWALRSFETLKIFEVSEVVDTAPVIMGKADSVPLTIGQDVSVTVPRMARGDIEVQIAYAGPLEAPLKKGQVVGKAVVAVPGMEPKEYDLLAGEDVARLGVFSGALEKAKLMLTGGPSS